MPLARLQPPPAQQTRRNFLARLAAGTVVAGTAGLSAPASILAANDGPSKLPPDYLSGVLLHATQGYLELLVPGHGPMTVLLTDGTQFCKGSCELSWEALRSHDRVECGTHDNAGGVRVAEWVNANHIYSWGTIESISGNIINVAHIEEMPFMSGPDRRLHVDSYTKVDTDGHPVFGRTDTLQVGDMLYYTGCANEPNPDAADVMAILIVRGIPVKVDGGA